MRMLLVGGSKSGKSHRAQELVRSLAEGSPMYYWATMEPTDNEDEARVAKHLEDREGWGFTTIERGRRIAEEPRLPRASAVLFDSVTALLANEMFAEGFDPEAPERVLRELSEVSSGVEHFVCVADEIFRDGIVYDETTEAYRRGLALVLRGLAREFDTVCEVVCGEIKARKGNIYNSEFGMLNWSERR